MGPPKDNSSFVALILGINLGLIILSYIVWLVWFGIDLYIENRTKELADGKAWCVSQGYDGYSQGWIDRTYFCVTKDKLLVQIAEPPKVDE